MDFREYQADAMRTRGIYTERVFTAQEQQLLCGCLGISGESGEFNDAIKKMMFHNKPIPNDVLSKEIGDTLWYIALICDAKGWNLNDIAYYNIEKLRIRYPQGFNYARANNPSRDIPV
jgi:NTP pyrophosphatase (non-canonical NTP hydrolase)